MGSDKAQRQCQEVAEEYGCDQGGRGHSLLLWWLNSDTNLFPLGLFCPCESHVMCDFPWHL